MLTSMQLLNYMALAFLLWAKVVGTHKYQPDAVAIGDGLVSRESPGSSRPDNGVHRTACITLT